MTPFLLLLVDDLMAGSRIEVAARHLGYEVRYARSVDQFRAGIDDRPALVLLGTHHTRLPWETLLTDLRGHGDAPPVLAFGSHMDTATRQRARQAGVTRWVANSKLASELPSLIRRLAREPASRPPSDH